MGKYPQLTHEQRMEALQLQLEELKAEFKTATTPSVRQLIHEDISGTLDMIDRLQVKMDKEQTGVTTRQQTHENTGQLIRTVCQDLHYGNSSIDQDTVISSLVADGWQVFNVAIIAYTDNTGDRPVNGVSRYTTLVKHTPVKS